MTSLTPRPTHRPKKVVRYGKASSRSSYNADNIGDFMGDDEPASPPLPPSSTKLSTTPTATPAHHLRLPIQNESPQAPNPSSQKEQERQAKPKERKMRPAVQKPKAQKPDAFDVPSSDDEVDIPVPMKRASPPKIKKRNALVDDRGVDVEMAPWEKKRGTLKPTTERTKTPKKEDPKQKPSKISTASTDTTKTRRNIKEVGITRPAQSPAEPPPTTAAARLAARRQRANGDAPTSNSQAEVVPVTERPGLATDPNTTNPRKRARISPPTEMEKLVDVEMNDAPDCDLPPSQPSIARTEMSVFDLPDYSDQEQQTTSKRPSRTNSTAPRNRSRQGRLPSLSKRRTAAQKGVSAPGRLMEMLPQDTSGTDPATSAPSRSSRGTSQSHPSTSARKGETPAETAPVRDDSSSPAPSSAAASPAGANKTGTLTPKQKRLWSHLLPSDDLAPHDEAPTPSSLAMRDLRLTGKGKRDDANFAGSTKRRQPGLLAKSQSDVSGLVDGGRKRVKLVDRLKASRVSEDEDEEDEDEEMEDVRFSSSSQPLPHIRHTDSQEISMTRSGEAAGATSTGSINIPNHFSTAQHTHHPPLDKTAATAPTAGTTGAKITYARARSYLPEDNLEDGLLFSLPSTTTPQQQRPTLPRPKPSTASNRGASTSQNPQQNPFDLNPTDSDSDSNPSIDASGGGGHARKTLAGHKTKPARLRTIHELRASGRNARFRREVEGLLEEIVGFPAPLAATSTVVSQDPMQPDGDASSEGEERRGRKSKALVVLARNFLVDLAGGGSSGGGGAGRKGQLKKRRAKGGDDGYIGRFLAEGFETRLVGIFSQREGEERGGVQRRKAGRRGKRGFGRGNDDDEEDGVEDVGDFALVACLLALLVSPETSVHVLKELGDQGVVGWLVGRLEKGTDVDGLIGRSRRIGLDEAMMEKFGGVVEILRGLDGVWDASGGHEGGDAGGTSGAPEKITMRVLCLKALELLVRGSRREGDRREFLSEEQLEKVLLDPSDDIGDEQDGDVDLCTAISLLESLSTSALALAWPETLLRRLSALFPRLATAGMETSPSSSKPSRPRHEHLPQQQRAQQHTLFLLYRLTLNLTTDHPRNCAFFATRETFSALLTSIYASFLALDAPLISSSPNLPTTNPKPQHQQQQSSPSPPPSRALTLDLLILALGIAINLTTTDSSDHDISGSANTLFPLLIDPKDPLSALFAQLIEVFKSGRVRIDRELDSPPPDEGGKGHTARSVVEGEGLSAGQTGGGREREVLPRERQQGQQGGGEEGDGQGEEKENEGNVGFNIAWGYLAVFLGKCCSFPSPSSSSSSSSPSPSSSKNTRTTVGGKEIRRFVASYLHSDEKAGDGQSGGAVGGQQQKSEKKTEKAKGGVQGSGRKEEEGGGGGGGLEILVQAVEEFVVYHQRVDGMMMDHGNGGGGGKSQSGGSSAAKAGMRGDEDGLMSARGGEKNKEDEEVFAGQEGKEVWSAFTEKLRLVLERLKRAVAEDV
ncbi:hypothetical protein KC345_g7173 [Hortaea werneckii]|nr:hypothetical protein KC345_g7173 [Hortaea werneckii]